MELFKGIARKLILPCIVLSAVGWLLVVIGYGTGSHSHIHQYYNSKRHVAQPANQPDMYPYWMLCFSGPFTLAAAVAHAALWKPFSPIAGAATSFFSVLFLTCLGMVLFQGSRPTYHGYDHEYKPAYYALEFTGALIATLFWIPVEILQHFYDGFKVPRSEYERLT